MNYITEPQRKISVDDRYDVAVVGGGVAGIAAALASARAGAKTVLIEKQFMLGGLATLGLVTIYLPLCDGLGNQVTFGIAEELFHLSMKHGYEDKYPAPWLEGGTKEERAKRRFEVRYNANVFAILCEQLLISEGVDILYGTSVCSVDMADDKINAIIVENKSGRSALKIKSVADCSGDADISKLSGAQTALTEQKNILAGWYYFQKDNKVDLKMLGFSDIPDKYKTDAERAINQTRYLGVDAWELSKMTSDSHRFLLDDFLKSGGINENHALTSVATIPQVRMTRRICGEYTIDDTEMHKHFDDSIGMVGDWRKSGPVYEIPFKTLISGSVKNLVTAGRCISVTDAMWDVTRVIPVCAVTGEAAGAAAALSDDFSSLDISKLQNHLQKNNVKLHINEVL